MKILKYGEGYPKTVTCDKCKSDLEYDTDDIKTFTSECKNIDEGKIQIMKRRYVVCPVCKQSINFGMELLYEYELPQSPFTKPKPKKRWWRK